MIVIVVVIVVVLGGGVLAFNGLVRRRNRPRKHGQRSDVELKRRHDLIPNLVETVKGYAAHEQGTFEAVTAARAGAISAGATGDPAKIAPAENMLSQSLRSLFAVAENYPQLRAVESFLQLQEQLTATQDKLEYARRYYNTSARDFNMHLRPSHATSLPARSDSTVGFFQTDRSRACRSRGQLRHAAAGATPAATAVTPRPPARHRHARPGSPDS